MSVKSCRPWQKPKFIALHHIMLGNTTTGLPLGSSSTEDIQAGQQDPLRTALRPAAQRVPIILCIGLG